MAGKVTNCTPFREQMPDAASDSLSGSVRSAFNAHLRDCAACGDEFRRVQTLAQKIDRILSVSLAAEPSSQLVANVRKSILQDVSLQQHGAVTWRRWSAWATVAGVCAAFAIVFFVARTSRKFSRPTHESAVVQTRVSPILKPAVHPRLNANTETVAARPRKHALGLARRASLRTSHEKAAEPEIIVEPGQMQAIFQLVAATQRGEINGANLFNSEKKAAEPLEIKSLVIAPLKISVLEDESEPPASNGGLDSDKSSLDSRSN
jgi:hypothetical protein